MKALRALLPFVLAVFTSFGYGRWAVSANGDDPLAAIHGPYLITYGVAPIVCLLAVREAWASARELVLVRAHTVHAWWRQRVVRGAASGAILSLMVVGGAVAASFGRPVPTIGQVLVAAWPVTVVLMGLSMITFGAAAAAALRSRQLLVVVAIVSWLVVLFAARRGGGSAVWGMPARLAGQPESVIHMLWPLAAMAAGTVMVDLVRQGRREVVLRPIPAYAAIAMAALLTQALVGASIVGSDGRVTSVVDPVRLVLGGVTHGGLRQFLFVTIVWVGYAAAFAVHLTAHHGGPGHQELIRAGSVGRWLWRRTWPWIVAAPMVPAAAVIVAFIAVRAMPSAPTPPPVPFEVAHVVASGWLQLVVYLLVVLLVHRVIPSSAGGIVVMVVLLCLEFLRLTGIPIPGVAMNGLTDVVSIATTVETCVVLVVVSLGLATAIAVIIRLTPAEWSIQP